MLVVNEAALKADVLVIVGCFALIADARSPMPVNVMLLVALSVAADTELTLTELLVVNVFCFVPTAVEIEDMMSVPAKYRGPDKIMLDPIIAEPPISIDGADTAAVNTAVVLVSPSLSTPLKSAKRRVWFVAGFSSEQVSSDSCNGTEEDKTLCFPASAAVSPVTSAMATGCEDCCAAPSACKTFVDPTMSCPSMVQFPLTPSAPVT